MNTDLTWHGKMHSHLQEINRTREAQGRILTSEQIDAFEKEYDKLLDLADQEYHDNPPSDCYRKGYNLAKEFREYKDSVLLFLRRPEVDFTNNEAERCGRQVKRHMVNSGTFRGGTGHSAEEYCAAMGVLQTAKSSGENIYEMVQQVFQRETPKKKYNVTVEKDDSRNHPGIIFRPMHKTSIYISPSQRSYLAWLLASSTLARV